MHGRVDPGTGIQSSAVDSRCSGDHVDIDRAIHPSSNDTGDCRYWNHRDSSAASAFHRDGASSWTVAVSHVRTRRNADVVGVGEAERYSALRWAVMKTAG